LKSRDGYEGRDSRSACFTPQDSSIRGSDVPEKKTPPESRGVPCCCVLRAIPVCPASSGENVAFLSPAHALKNRKLRRILTCAEDNAGRSLPFWFKTTPRDESTSQQGANRLEGWQNESFGRIGKEGGRETE